MPSTSADNELSKPVSLLGKIHASSRTDESADGEHVHTELLDEKNDIAEVLKFHVNEFETIENFENEYLYDVYIPGANDRHLGNNGVKCYIF